MADARIIYVDTETTGIDYIKDGRHYLQGISVDYPVGNLGFFNAYFPFRHADKNLDHKYIAQLAHIFDSKPLVFHNLKFDLHSLKTIGIEPKDRLFDTMMIAHMVNENWPSKKLDWLGKILVKQGKQKSEELESWIKAFGWHTVPADLMAEYASFDASLTRMLFEILWRMFCEQDLKGLWPIEADYTKLLVKIESNGVKVDRGFCNYKVDIGTERMDDILESLGWNPGSGKDLEHFLLDDLQLPPSGEMTPGGKHSFNKKAMEYYDDLLEILPTPRQEAKLVLEYRGWQKAVSSLYKPALELSSPDGRVRPNFNQHGTKTGRLSCSGPNLQQIPRNSDHTWNGDAKQAFTFEDGFIGIEFDYSQLEFRLATAYGRDRILLDTFNSGEDVFIPIANDIFGGPEFRQHAKTLVYSTLYGAGVNRIMVALGLSEDAATATRERFRNYYPGIYEKSELARRNVESKGYVKYWTGRRRHLPKTESHKAFNSVIQGGAAELVKRSMLRVDANICTSSAIRTVLTVHDSIVLEIKRGLEEEVVNSTVKLMTDWPDFGVKFDVDVNVWGRKDGLESLTA